MTQGDLRPVIQATLKYLDGTTVDLSGATGIIFSMKKENGEVIVDGKAGSIINVSGGIIQYDWADGDTDVSGVCYAEFVVSFSGGTGVLVDPTLTFPAKGDFEIRFRAKISAGA